MVGHGGWNDLQPRMLRSPQLVRDFGDEAPESVSNTELEECSFVPAINSSSVPSTMGDFMQGWSERRQFRLSFARLQKCRAEVDELSARPEQWRTKTVNEALLRGTGYMGPVQGWHHHAERRRQSREPSKAPAVASSRPRSCSDVVQRLYPYSKVAAPLASEAVGVLEKGRPAAVPTPSAARETSMASTTSRLCVAASDYADDLGESSLARSGDGDSGQTPRDARSPGPSTEVGRHGRPPTATWQYLYEHGTKQVRKRSSPPRPASCSAPKPIPQSEELLRLHPRRPLYNPPVRVVSDPKLTGSGVRCSQKTSETDSCVRSVLERSEKQRLIHEQRVCAALELKNLEEMRECTFRPSTTSRGRAQSLSLYDRGKSSQERRRQLEENRVQRQEADELRECTFHPRCTSRRVPKNAAVTEQAKTFNTTGHLKGDVCSKVEDMLCDWRASRHVAPFFPEGAQARRSSLATQTVVERPAPQSSDDTRADELRTEQALINIPAGPLESNVYSKVKDMLCEWREGTSVVPSSPSVESVHTSTSAAQSVLEKSLPRCSNDVRVNESLVLDLLSAWKAEPTSVKAR